MHDLDTDPDDVAIVCAIITLAHSLTLGVVAKGVETRSQPAFLQSHHCDGYQGLLTSRAVVPNAFDALLRNSRLPQLTVLAA